MVLEQNGSSSNIGYGYTEYDIIDEKDNLPIQSHRYPNFLPKCAVVAAENGNISAFNEWLKKLSQKNISIDEMLKPAKNSQKQHHNIHNPQYALSAAEGFISNHFLLQLSSERKNANNNIALFFSNYVSLKVSCFLVASYSQHCRF